MEFGSYVSMNSCVFVVAMRELEPADQDRTDLQVSYHEPSEAGAAAQKTIVHYQQPIIDRAWHPSAESR